jgi:hypothetical protein
MEMMRARIKGEVREVPVERYVLGIRLWPVQQESSMIDVTRLSQSIPDERCPECGNDVDENCQTLDNCPRYYTGIYGVLKED